MNKKVFGFNWLFRSSNGWLYGYTFKPAVIINNHPLSQMLFGEPEVRSVKNDKPSLIKETDKSLDFIKKNKLYHISELTKSNEDECSDPIKKSSLYSPPDDY